MTHVVSTLGEVGDLHRDPAREPGCFEGAVSDCPNAESNREVDECLAVAFLDRHLVPPGERVAGPPRPA